MCSSRQIIDPGNLLFNPKTNKYADPLGLTKTAIGDPTGRIRKEHAAVKRENMPHNPGTILGWQNIEGVFRPNLNGSTVGV